MFAKWRGTLFSGTILVLNPKLDVYLAKWFKQLNHLVLSIVDPNKKPRGCTDYQKAVPDSAFELAHQAYANPWDTELAIELYDSLLEQAFQDTEKRISGYLIEFFFGRIFLR